jgi:tetratricopeptide (TPR) repeat protein
MALAMLYTEGKTDCKYLKKALLKLNLDYDFEYHENDYKKGDNQLLKLCDAIKEAHHDIPQIFIFDQDNPETIKKVTDRNKPFKYWQNKVYSFVLPTPQNRNKYKGNICIEYYFTDEEIKTVDQNGKRLYISSEFSFESARLLNNSNISYGLLKKLKDPANPQNIKIIDDDVFDESSRKISLSKNNFADNICNDVKPFDNFDFNNFSLIFNIVGNILKDNNITLRKSQIILKDHPPSVKIFVGRHGDIDKLQNENIRVAAITGLGGEGKSSLASKFYQNALNKKSKQDYQYVAWADCKVLETPFHEKLLSILEVITEGEQSKSKYAEENIHDTILRFIEFLNTHNCLIVFDNVDAFVSTNDFTFTDNIKYLFDNIVSKLSLSLVIFTCRSSVSDYHSSFIEIPIMGLSINEAIELAHLFELNEKIVSEEIIISIHEATKGHALWLNLIFGQLRSQRTSVNKITELISKNTTILDVQLLRSIWETLGKNEREIIWVLSTFSRPPDIDRIRKVSKTNYKKTQNILDTLVRLRLINEVEIKNKSHYDLHPIIKVKANEMCRPEKKNSLIKDVIVVLTLGNWKRIIKLELYELECYIEAVEVAIENKQVKAAIEYLDEISDHLLKYGEDALFLKLAKELFSIIDLENIKIGFNEKLNDIYSWFIRTSLEQGEYDSVNKNLEALNPQLNTIKQFIFYSGLRGYSLWFQNNFPEAIEFINSSIKQIKDKGETVPGSLYNDLALSYRDAGEVEKALNVFIQKCPLEIVEKWNPETGDNFSADTGNIGRCYYLLGDHEKALALCNKSVLYLRKKNDRNSKVNLGYGLLWLSDINIKLEKYPEAIQNIIEAYNQWSKYCPVKLRKIKRHIKEYPATVLTELKTKGINEV